MTATGRAAACLGGVRSSMMLGALALAACQGAPAPADPALTALAPPTGWTARHEPTRVTFEDPDHALRLVIARSESTDLRSAVASAWFSIDPAMLAAPQAVDVRPPEDGWDDVATIDYTLPATSGRSASAEWRRLGTRGYVALVVGDGNAVARREAQISELVEALHPADLRDEQLPGQRVRALDTAALDAFVDRAHRELEVPGAALAVIIDGKVVYERTLGVRALGEPAPITADTRFLLASVSKPLTTLMEATLVDAGTVRWDEPVTQVLPDFALGDADVTRALQLWHMSCACTGMPRQDMEGLFEWRDITPEARLAAMRAMKPTTKLGETFQYSNLMVAAGGFATAHAFAPELPLARAYAKAMTDKVFAPIGMTSTTVDFATVAAGDHARPHALAIDGTTRVLPLDIERAVEPIAPAGAVWSTLHDMERYAMVELADGETPDGTRVVTAANLRERARERVKSGAHDGYGLGLDVEDLHGLRVLGHDGGAFGFGTTLRLLPEQHVGIVILTNIRNGNAKQQLPFNAAVTRRIYEALFANARAGLADRVLAYALTLREHTPHAASPDHRWGAALAGRYHEPALGDLEVRDTPTGVVLDAGEWSSAIDRVVDPDGTARLVLLDPPFAGGTVIVGPGDPPTLVVPDQTTYTFARVR